MGERDTGRPADREKDPANWDEIDPGVPSTADTIPGGTTDDPSRTDPTRVVTDAPADQEPGSEGHGSRV